MQYNKRNNLNYLLQYDDCPQLYQSGLIPLGSSSFLSVHADPYLVFP